MRRAVLYVRVSTIDQMTANQERELREIAGRMGCKIVKVYKARPCFKCSTFFPSSSDIQLRSSGLTTLSFSVQTMLRLICRVRNVDIR